MPQNDTHLLTIPANAGRAIVESAAMLACPLLGTSRFASYCSDRGLSVNTERLLRLEHLRLFAPIFRVRTPDEESPSFHIPIRDGNNWFDKGWAWDTSGIGQTHDVPASDDRDQEGYYSIFQVDYLHSLLTGFTLQVQLDSYLPSSGASDFNTEQWMQHANAIADSSRGHQFRPAVALLCQYISGRYYPHTQSDQRTMQTGHGHYMDAWISVGSHKTDWHDYVRAWNPQSAEKLFQLTPRKLRHAYEALAVSLMHIDPLAKWHQLVQFVAVDERRRLKGDALLAETLRAGPLMLRMLHKDLYGEELPPPNEVTGHVITHIPELEIRNDTRRYLEFVVNRFHLNPQPSAVIIVEGPTEQRAIEAIFERGFGLHPGTSGIEILVLGGVDVATGTKEDRFRAIIRLIDYLHHHQTLAFLILDNERYARKLQHEARRAKSIHHRKRYVTRSEYITVWKSSYEFDNHASAEIADALTDLAAGKAKFSSAEIETCKQEKEPGAALKRLYRGKAGKKLDKMRLADLLVERLLSPKSRRKISNRPIVKALDRILRRASRNPFPTMQKYWEMNQGSNYLGKKRGKAKKS